MDGEYRENLPYGQGTLVVKKNGWSIQFYFSGPDRRYNGTFYTIQANEIDRYISAYQSNWKKYLDAKKLNLDGEMKIQGDMNMNVFIGGVFNGICLTSYYMPITSKREIDAIIVSLKWAKTRAESIKNFLNEAG